MLNARLATALVLLASFVMAAWWLPNPWWATLMLGALAAAAWEWSALAGLRGNWRALYVGAMVASAWAVGLASNGVGESVDPRSATALVVYGVSLVFWILLALPWFARQWQVQSPLALAAAGWLALVPAWLAVTQLQGDPAQLLALLAIVWVADTAAYFAGRKWGRHRLAPSVSPAKTWEGVAGACAGVAVYYLALSIFAPGWRGLDGWTGAALFAGITLMSIIGDLYESWLKRRAGVKDSGAWLPGHGGILDRIDSVISSTPFAALFLACLR
jgi:phosphatidate cytidylyltransferase